MIHKIRDIPLGMPIALDSVKTIETLSKYVRVQLSTIRLYLTTIKRSIDIAKTNMADIHGQMGYILVQQKSFTAKDNVYLELRKLAKDYIAIESKHDRLIVYKANAEYNRDVYRDIMMTLDSAKLSLDQMSSYGLIKGRITLPDIVTPVVITSSIILPDNGILSESSTVERYITERDPVNADTRDTIINIIRGNKK